MKMLTTFIFLFLAGCGSEEGRDNHGYGWHYDVKGETGLRVRYHQGQTTPNLEEIEQLYRDTMACTGIVSTGPLVIFVVALKPPYSRGLAYLDTGTVIIATAINDTPFYMNFTHKHEFIHHLLHQSGFNIAANFSHQSQLFTDCVRP